MTEKLIVTASTPEQRAQVTAAGAEVLAEYPDAVLVRATDEQASALTADGLQTVGVPSPEVQTASARFSFESALAAEAVSPIAADPNRTAYYLVQLVGPAKQEWLATVDARGGIVQGTLPGYLLIVGITPASAATLAAEPFVEDLVPYRPAMKVSPALRPDVLGRELGVEELTKVDTVGPVGGALEGRPDAEAAGTVQVQVSVFAGESAADVAADIRSAGGTVLSESDRTVLAFATPESLVQVAERQGVEAILPHSFPEFTNDRASVVMHVPDDRLFGSLTLTGAGQIVGITDSGIDTGVAATMHADLAGRVTIVSSPNQFGSSSVDPPPFDDGPADEMGHGTHVAGSVAGSGAAAVAAGHAFTPRGIAPDAAVHFTSIGQRVTWAPGVNLNPYGLYGIPNDLSNLFGPAYAAGVRIHTNSWGSRNTAANPNVEGSYNAQSRQVDAYSADHRDALVLFSAGNNGRDANADVQIDGDSIGTPGTAKNCLTVGASENNRPAGSLPTPGADGNWTAAFGARYAAFAAAGHVSDNTQGMALFSSRGPTDDGRRKPDVVAPGTNVLSSRSTAFNPVLIDQPAGSDILWGDGPAGYCWSGGTSMATPLVAGAAALIRQHLVTQRGHHSDGVTPSGALIKAILVNGADPISGQYPGEVPTGANSVQGFGLVNVAESIAPDALGQTLFADDPTLALSALQTRTFSVQAVDLAQPMKVTLVWTDPPSPVGAGGLQNQLSLQIAEPGGAVLEGDVTPFPNPTNNVQRLLIAAPVAGNYEIRVRASNIVTRSAGAGAPAGIVQDFAIAASNVMGLSSTPVTIAHAIDTTGSMDYFAFMEPAKERATQLVDFLRGGDRVSVSEFSQRSVPPDGRTPYPVRTLSTFNPDWTDAHAQTNSLHAEGNTPIGAGLLAAWGELSGEPSGRPRGIVLLSDGFNNTAPDPATVLPTIPSSVPIFAIALGPAASTSTLMSISASRPGGAYFSVGADEDVHHLHEIYAALQALSTGGALLGLDTVAIEGNNESGTEIAVEPGLDSVTFTASWSVKAGVELTLVDPHGDRRGAGSAGTQIIRGSTYQHIRVAMPTPGHWKLIVRSHEAVLVTTSASAASTLTLTADVVQRSRRKATIVARLAAPAGLTAGGQAIDEAKVRATVSVPTLSVSAALIKYGDEIAKMQLPDQLREPGLSKAEQRLVALAAFGAQYRSDPAGIYGRLIVEVDLSPAGNGTYTGTIAIPAAGTVRVDVRATGDLLGFSYQRHAQQSSVVTARPKRVP